MHEPDEVSASDSIREARECCDQIAIVLADTTRKAQETGDAQMLGHLLAAKSASKRAAELIASLEAIIHEQREPTKAAK